MSSEQEIRKQLEWAVMARKQLFPGVTKYAYACNEDIVLRHGEIFLPAAIEPPVPPVARACFHQAYRLTARKQSRWIYCEGFALNSLGIVIHHAWITPRAQPGAAVDLAWGYPPEDTRVYMGIRFQREFVIATRRASKGLYYSVLDTWWNNYPLITGEIKVEDVRCPQ